MKRLLTLSTLLIISFWCSRAPWPVEAKAAAAAFTTLTVTSLEDSGTGTLRQAIAAAGSNDTINFAVTGTITLTSGELVINKSLTLQGPGADRLIISGNSASRVIRITNGNYEVTLFDLMIANGKVESPKGTSIAAVGGGIYNNSTGILNLYNCVLTGNAAVGGPVIGSGQGIIYGADAFGGGLFNASSGTVNIRNSTISHNGVLGGTGANGLDTNGGSGWGGGIYNWRSGIINITDSTLSGNAAHGGGAAAGNGTIVGGNGSGGGILNAENGKVFINRSRFMNNSAKSDLATGGTDSVDVRGGDGLGGGIHNMNTGTVIVIISTFSGNVAKGEQVIGTKGGVGGNGFGGGINNADEGTLNISSSTFSGNAAIGGKSFATKTARGGNGVGGSIHNTSTITATNNTISGNAAAGEAASCLRCDPDSTAIGGNGQGGGIANTEGGKINLTSNTVFGNTASGGGGTGSYINSNGILIQIGSDGQSEGGGIYEADATLTMARNAIIAGNTVTGTSAQKKGPDIFGTLTSQGFNLIGNNADAMISDQMASDKVGTPTAPIDPRLDTLQFDGGPTQTHPLLPGSPAIDMGNSFGLTNDQRGTPRPQGSATDIGAYESIVNRTPIITGATLVRQQGSPGSLGQIATVNDAEDAETALSITVTPASGSGVIVSNPSVDSSGNVTAQVAAGCSATYSTFTLRVTDSGNLFQEATLTVNIIDNTPPTLSYPSNPGTMYGTGITISPLTGPSDNVSVSSVSLVSSPVSGITVASNGVITVTATVPAGSYSLTVRARDNCDVFTDASLTLGIAKAPLTVTAANAWRNQGEANPPLTGSLTGVVNGDVITVSYSTTATITSPPGAYPITAKLKDLGNRLNNYQVTNNPGTLTVQASCGFTVIPTAMAPALLALPYAQGLTVTPVGTHTFSLHQGSLPPGLQLVSAAGVFSLQGTPTTPGTYSFTLKAVRSGVACEALRTYVMTIPPSVVPKLNCLVYNANGTITAWFGYENATRAVVTIPVGWDNYFAPGSQNQGQVTTFQVGAVNNAFSVTYPNVASFTQWTLKGPDGVPRAVLPTGASPRCP